MNLVLDFTACMTNDCGSVEFCDTTCVYDPILPANCTNGYGYLDNPSKRDISYTRFSWLCPDGNVMGDLDLSWKPGTKSTVEFTVESGTNGIIIVDIDGLILGSTTFVTDVDTTVALLVASINSNMANTGWHAEIKYGTTDVVVITQNSYGVEYNNQVTTVTLSGDIAVTLDQPLTLGGTDETNCFCITPEDISTAAGSTDTVCNSYPDGVHTITYILFDDADQEIARKTKKFLFLCNLINGIKELMKSMADGTCACSHEEVDERIMKLRMMIEQAQAEFDECLFDCANSTVQKAIKLFERICTGC